MATLGVLAGAVALTLLGNEGPAPGSVAAPAVAPAVGGDGSVGTAAGLERTAPARDLGCWGAPIGSSFRHHVDDRGVFTIRTKDGVDQPAGQLHASCDVITTVLDRRDGEVLAECRLDGLRFLGADAQPITGDDMQTHFVAATAEPVRLRIDARGRVLGFGFAEGLDGDQRNFLRGTLLLFAFEAPAADAGKWTTHAADTTGEFDASYEVMPAAVDQVAVRRSKNAYTKIAGQDSLPEHELRGVAEARFDRTRGWLHDAEVKEGMTLSLPLLELKSISERTATVAFVDAGTTTVAGDLAAAWAAAGSPASGVGEAIGGYAAGNERRHWQEVLKGTTLDQILRDLQQVLAAQPVDDEALDGVFQKLQWMAKLDERATGQLAEMLATRQFDLAAARVVLGALGAAGTAAAQQALAAVCADRGASFELRQAATIAAVQLARPNAALVAGMLRDADSDSDLHGSSLLAFGALAPRAEALADGRSPVAALLAMEGTAAARGELANWMLAVANSNPPETFAIADRLLGHQDAEVRAAACVALNGQAAPAALQDLVERGVVDSEPNVRLEALLALGRRSEPAARAAIERVADSDPNQQLRERAQRMLGRGA